MFKGMRTICLGLFFVVAFNTAVQAADTIRFGVPPWPGVTVKTEVVCQLLEALGYTTKRFEIGPPIIYKGLTSDEIDAFLGAWTPQQNPMIEPLLEKKEIEVVKANLDEARISLCVPDYVAKEGVKSFADLDAHKERFDGNIYDIEVGSGMHTAMEDIIAQDIAGLGDWEHEGSTTPAMLSQVKNLIRNRKWVTFGCWKPHWMNIDIDMEYLEGVPGTERYVSQSLVYTIVSKDFKNQNPQVHSFFQQFYISAEAQSKWIYDYGYKKIDLEKVAFDWIRSNMDTVGTWFAGVNAQNGQPAMSVLQAYFK
jgi:glycine betaine/proline transport system substrate-binding protein